MLARFVSPYGGNALAAFSLFLCGFRRSRAGDSPETTAANVGIFRGRAKPTGVELLVF